MVTNTKSAGTVVEYLDQGKLRAGLVLGEPADGFQLLEASGRERTVARELVLIRHPERKADPASLAAVLADLEQERVRLAAELDLELLWGVVQEQGRSFSAAELSELFFGRRSSAAASVMLEALFNDRLYFVRRHLEFAARTPEQVERLRIQNEKTRQRGEEYRQTLALIRAIAADGSVPEPAAAAPLITELSRYLKNPSTRSSELTTMLTQAMPEVDPAEIAFEILERLGAAPDAPRFALIGGLRMEFSAATSQEAAAATAGDHPRIDDQFMVTIDDEETLEVDDALSCAPTPDGGLKVRICIALVADFVQRDGALDAEAAARAATVYLPEATVRMLPDELSCRRASLLAGEERPALTTEVTLAPDGELLASAIFPATIKVAARLDYELTDRMLADRTDESAPAVTVQRLQAIALKLRERRRSAGAALFIRSEAKVKVRAGQIEIKVIDNSSPSRQMVAEFMVLSNFVAAKFAADNRIPIIYRVQPGIGSDPGSQRPRLSLYPELHTGVGLDRYAQLSSPIRRYGDLVLQRQLMAALSGAEACMYRPDELLTVLAAMENTEGEGKDLERRSKRYWVLRYLQENRKGQALSALVTRDGISAELAGYAVRGALRGAPNASTGTRIRVEVMRVDPLRGTLTLAYRGPDVETPAAATRQA
jgi:exoribonuclease-2